ncbi:hypothetical protein [Massilia cavernae]|nr:hypothetical protein [Massilia cavernae]
MALLFLAAALAGIAAVLYATAPAAPATPALAAPPAAKVRTTGALAAAAVPAPKSAAGAQSHALTEAMRKRFESAPNYAAFIHDALQRPLEGGRFYAVLAYHRCESLNGIEAKHFSMHAQSDRRDKDIVVIKDMMQRCAGVQEHFPDYRVIHRRLVLGNARGVPDVLSMEPGLLRLRQTDKARAISELERALASRDPYLIATMIELNLEHYATMIELNLEHYASLLGKGYSREQHRTMLYAASAGAVCEITGTCTENLHLQMMCAAGGYCQYSDVRDYVRGGFSAEETRAFNEIKRALMALARK